ncbi:MAG: hypothetical protein ACREA7_10210, partial [Nitrosotalea sp.]
SKELQKDRTDSIIDLSSYHFKRTLAAIVRVTFLTGEEWHYTSTIVQQYRRIWLDGANLLTYRRVSEIIREIANTGFLISQESSRGRRGYGKQYKLTVSPREIGPKMDYTWWHGMVKAKKIHAGRVEFLRQGFATTEKKKDSVARMEALERTANVWSDYVWLDKTNLEEEAMKDESSA